jgi:hypothetical protein
LRNGTEGQERENNPGRSDRNEKMSSGRGCVEKERGPSNRNQIIIVIKELCFKRGNGEVLVQPGPVRVDIVFRRRVSPEGLVDLLEGAEGMVLELSIP